MSYDEKISSRLLGLELRRVAYREDRLEDVESVLDGIGFIPIEESLLEAAESLPPANVATVDSIHLATATRLAADGYLDALMTYDVRLAGGAREHGIEVVAPGG